MVRNMTVVRSAKRYRIIISRVALSLHCSILCRQEVGGNERDKILKLRLISDKASRFLARRRNRIKLAKKIMTEDSHAVIVSKRDMPSMKRQDL